MRRLPIALLDALDLPGATTAEVNSRRNLLPPEPWLGAVAANVSEIASWVRSRLENGSPNSPAPIANARKFSQGNRPVAVVGIAERIAYRALTGFALSGTAPANREASAYREFVVAPIKYAIAGLGPIWTFEDPTLAYVVEADIAAFYQYVDHEVLHEEVVLQTGRVEAADYLCELLAEIQGAKYGLPQLLDPSDELSELYIRIMERDLARRGQRLWRYNDDFRIGAVAYEQAQDAVEQLAEAARKIGLVLSDHKTYITRFTNYLLRYVDVNVDTDAVQVDPSDVEAAVVDYPNLDDDESFDVASHTLSRLDLAPDDAGRLDMKNLTSEDLRSLRRAIGTFTRLVKPEALKRVSHLYLFAPALTPRLVDYLIATHTTNASEVAAIWENIAIESGRSLSEWQSMWLLYAARRLGMLTSEQSVAYAERQRTRSPGTLLAAEAALALAENVRIEFDELDVALRMEPEALSPWYALGIKALANAGVVADQRVQAVKASSPMYKILIDS